MINYTPEITQELIKLYLAAEDKIAIIDFLAEKYEKPKKSIIGKLSKEGVYQKRVYKSKTGAVPVTKKEMIHNLSLLISADAEKLQGLEKAPKMELEYLISVINLKKDEMDYLIKKIQGLEYTVDVYNNGIDEDDDISDSLHDHKINAL